jgi:hypothetical protein
VTAGVNDAIWKVDWPPVPDIVIVWGLFVALSVIVMVPNRFPDAVGVNVTLIVQVAPAATLVGQLLTWPKSPLEVTLEITSAALPVLVSVTACTALVV